VLSLSISSLGDAYITVGGNYGDRNNLTLWQNGDALIRELASVNPNTVVLYIKLDLL
jgi:beta-glucosidase